MDRKIEDAHHVVRHCEPSYSLAKHDDGRTIPSEEAFLKGSENGISTNWIEYYSSIPFDESVRESIKLMSGCRTIRKSHLLAILQVGEIRQRRLSVRPEPIDEPKCRNPGHALITHSDSLTDAARLLHLLAKTSANYTSYFGKDFGLR